MIGLNAATRSANRKCYIEEINVIVTRIKKQRSCLWNAPCLDEADPHSPIPTGPELSAVQVSFTWQVQSSEVPVTAVWYEGCPFRHMVAGSPGKVGMGTLGFVFFCLGDT